MRPVLTATLAGAAVAAALSGCGASHVVAGAGALASASAPLDATPTFPAPTPITAAPTFGGTPAVRAHLRSGATPAVSPVLSMRGTTWAHKSTVPVTVPLATGGYEAESFVTAERHAGAGQQPPYRCAVTFSLSVPGGALLWRSGPDAPGTQSTTFVVAKPARAALSGTGPPGCTWALILFPA